MKKRRRLWWFAALIFCAVATAVGLAGASGDEPDVSFMFLHYTNSTARMSPSEQEFFRDRRFLPPAPPPETHVVIVLTNGTSTTTELHFISLGERDSRSFNGYRESFDSVSPINPGIPRYLKPGEATTVELKVFRCRGPWAVHASYVRLNWKRKLLVPVIRHLPGRLQLYLINGFLASEVASAECGDAPPDPDSTSFP